MCEYLPDKKKCSSSNENVLFLQKIDETIWKSPLSERTPLSTNPLFLSSLSMTPLFVQISKMRTSPLILGEGSKLYIIMENSYLRYGQYIFIFFTNALFIFIE